MRVGGHLLMLIDQRSFVTMMAVGNERVLSVQEVCEGEPAPFAVIATGEPFTDEKDLRYQWRRNGVDIPGATASTLILSNVKSADEDAYDVVVTGAGGQATSNTASLTVDFVKIKKPIAPAPISVNAGDKADFTIEIDSQGAVSAQWYRDGNPLSDKAGLHLTVDKTSISLTIDEVKMGDAGSYTVAITAGKCKPVAPPLAFTLTVKCPTITLSPDQPLTGCRVATPYNRKFIPSGGTPPYKFDLADSVLPTILGLTLNSDGSLTGTPKAKTGFTFTVRVTDKHGCVGSQRYTIVM